MHRSEVQKVWTIASPRTWISLHNKSASVYPFPFHMDASSRDRQICKPFPIGGFIPT
jgi:hypothetical protein